MRTELPSRRIQGRRGATRKGASRGARQQSSRQLSSAGNARNERDISNERKSAHKEYNRETRPSRHATCNPPPPSTSLPGPSPNATSFSPPIHIPHIPTPVYEPRKLIHTSYFRPKPRGKAGGKVERSSLSNLAGSCSRWDDEGPTRPIPPRGMQLVPTAAAAATTLWRGRLLVGVGVVELRRVP